MELFATVSVEESGCEELEKFEHSKVMYEDSMVNVEVALDGSTVVGNPMSAEYVTFSVGTSSQAALGSELLMGRNSIMGILTLFQASLGEVLTSFGPNKAEVKRPFASARTTPGEASTQGAYEPLDDMYFTSLIEFFAELATLMTRSEA